MKQSSSILRRGLILATALSLLSVSGANAAPADGGPGQSFRKGMRERIAAELNLTDAQRQQIQAIFKQNLPTVKPVLEQLAKERAALQEAISATPVNEAAIRAQSAKVAAIQADLAVRRAKVREQVTAILTPEQAAKAREMRAKISERMQNRLQHLGEHQDQSGTL